MPIKIEDTMSMDGVDSLSGDDISNGGTTDTLPLKKGPWTTAEDTLLVDYVTKHGEGNWNAIQKHSGLARCGKSCRLRWSNHLRPDLKKGAFTPDEERCIVELHAKIGNKWARMAAELPGRTDNEIKNYWNTRIKRRQRAGLPIYPPGICFQALTVSQHDEEVSRFRSGNPQHHDLFPVNNFEISAVDFKYLEYNQQLYSSVFTDIPAGSFLDIPSDPLPVQELNFSSMNPFKRLRASDPPFDLSSAYSTGAVLPSSQYYGDTSAIGQSYGIFSVYDHDHDPDYLSPSCTLTGSHALLNGNFSPSESTPLTMKLGLPSLQSQIGIWGSSSSPVPSLKSVDTLIRSPLTELTASGSLSPRNSGLLDAVLHESKTIKNNSIPQTSADVNPADSMNDSSQDPHENGDPTSPLGHSASLVFNELTPKSVDYTCECQSFDAMQGHDKQEAAELPTLQSDIEKETSDDLIFSSPEVFLSCWQFSA